MRRLLSFVLGVACLVLFLACSNPFNKSGSSSTSGGSIGSPVDQELAQLKGTWEATEGEILGIKRSNAPGLKAIKWTFNGDQLRLTDRRGSIDGIITLNPSASPKTFDFKDAGGTAYGIYELSGDTLKVCYDLKKRPTTFTTTVNEPQTSLYVLKRISN
jgi:uncharacterized protein (TIGR03067 family)